MLIRIDRSTFKRNPSAGNTTSTFATGLTDMRGTYEDESGHYELVGSNFRLLVVEAHYTGPSKFTVGQEYEPSAFDPSRLSIETTRDVQTVHHRPEPDWLYEYEPTHVTCNECGATFPHHELTSDCQWTGDEEICSFTVCPKCDAWECCEVEYESPDDVARELALHDSK